MERVGVKWSKDVSLTISYVGKLCIFVGVRFLTIFFPAQTKAFFAKDADESFVNWIHRTYDEADARIVLRRADGHCVERSWADALTNVFHGLRWFWTFYNLQNPEQGLAEGFWNARWHILALFDALEFNQNPAPHYLLNHSWEDYVRWGPLWFLNEESGESIHAVHNKLSKAGTNGRDSVSDKYNTWSSILRAQAASTEIAARGITQE